VDKLEVLPGPGLVARYEEVAVWAGPQASTALQVHLVNEAQRTGRAPNGGDQLASALIAILQRGDPEPQAPFAVVGPGANGLTLFLHGPVQAWDSGRWLAPQPVPGWMVTSVSRPWPLIILPYGASPPPQSQQGNPMDLVVGAVPGSGFVMLRPPTAGGQVAGAPQATAVPPAGPSGPAAPVEVAAAGAAAGALAPGTMAPGVGTGTGVTGTGVTGTGITGGAGVGAAEASGGAAGAGSPGPGAPIGSGVGTAEVAGAGVIGAAAGIAATGMASGHATGEAPPDAVSAVQAQPGATAVAAGASSPPLVPTDGGASAGTTVDLRSVFGAVRPPLAVAGLTAPSFAPDQPEVVGVRCELGHFNHPRVANCMRCGRPIQPGTPQVSGPRPPVGVLLADDGSIWSLDRGCLIGTNPGEAPEVQSGAAQPLTMRAGTNHAMAPVQAEVQIRDWTAYLVDRGAEGGSWMQGPNAQGWEQLSRNEQRELADGAHVSCGGRVLTYLSAWLS
jgi:hypothetical protein